MGPEVVLEATYGWYWAADVLAEAGASVHLAHPLGNPWRNRRVKNDERDATDLVDLLRLGRLAEACIVPPPPRELRELVRHRAKLVAVGLKAHVHAVLAKEGVAVTVSGGRRRCPQRGAPAHDPLTSRLRLAGGESGYPWGLRPQPPPDPPGRNRAGRKTVRHS